jgi:hypothetical protein
VIGEPPNGAAARRLEALRSATVGCLVGSLGREFPRCLAADDMSEAAVSYLALTRVSREQIELSAAFIVALSDFRVAPTLAWIASK